MEETIKILNELQEKKLLRKYAIGGGIATIFYVEPVLTYDLDIYLKEILQKYSLNEKFERFMRFYYEK